MDRLRHPLMLLLFLTSAACGGDATGPTRPELVGTWQQVSMRGEPLPATVIDIASGRPAEWIGSTLTVDPGGTGSWQARIRVDGTTDTRTQSITWTQTGDAVQLVGEPGSIYDRTTYSGFVSADSLSFATPLGTSYGFSR